MNKREKQPSSKIYIWRSFVQVQSAVSPNILNTEQELNSQLSISPSTHQFSWISLLREVLMLFSVTRLGNLSSSFFFLYVCAMLGHLPLVAIPFSFVLNFTAVDSMMTSPIPEVELYWPFSKLLICYSDSGEGRFITIQSLSSNILAPGGYFIWCNGTLTKKLSKNIDPSMSGLPLP